MDKGLVLPNIKVEVKIQEALIIHMFLNNIVPYDIVSLVLGVILEHVNEFFFIKEDYIR